MPRIHQELRQLALEALGLGLECISDGDHVPFVLVHEANDKRYLVNLETKSGTINAELVDVGRELIREYKKTGNRYALVWDGYLTTDEVKQDAVFVEAGRQGTSKAYVFAQKYKTKGRSKAIEKDGDPIVVADAKNLWS